jgi:hypothetical protein
MKFSSMRSAVVIASVIVGSVIPSQAFAQVDVFSSFSNQGATGNSLNSSYKFNGSMILNSIGFLTTGGVPTALSYSINGTEYKLGTDFNLAQLSPAEYGIQYLTIDRSMVNDDVVIVNTTGGFGGQAAYYEYVVNPSANVSYQGMTLNQNPGAFYGNLTNSNLRVSNPGSNVAPEPGTFALALTGGGALIGICIRRRRNAA